MTELAFSSNQQQPLSFARGGTVHSMLWANVRPSDMGGFRWKSEDESFQCILVKHGSC